MRYSATNGLSCSREVDSKILYNWWLLLLGQHLNQNLIGGSYNLDIKMSVFSGCVLENQAPPTSVKLLS